MRDLDDMLADHGDLEGVLEELICEACGDELIMTDEEGSGLCQNCLNE